MKDSGSRIPLTWVKLVWAEVKMLKNPVGLLLVFLGLTILIRRQTDRQRRLFSALGVWMVAACKTSSCCLGIRAWVQLIHYNVWVYNLCGYLC
jgi:hypothetical protein